LRSVLPRNFAGENNRLKCRSGMAFSLKGALTPLRGAGAFRYSQRMILAVAHAAR
jgi:hypothetical protein